MSKRVVFLSAASTLVLVVLTACGSTRNSSNDAENSLHDSVGYETMTDSRDGQIYKTINVGDKVWMAENLNYETEYSVCYNNYESFCMKYGRLYTWKAANEACPAGWRLPTETDWVDLLRMASVNVSAEQSLNSRKGWDGNANGLGILEFSAFPTGYFKSDEDRFGKMGDKVFFWSATEINGDSSFAVNLQNNSDVNNLIHKLKNFGFSVRCVKDKLPSGKQQQQKAETMKDSRDGRTYKTVKIGKQTWMAENLIYKTQSSFCYGDSSSCEKYGQLYDWRSLVNICPAGWHLPRKADWETLINAVGGEAVAGKMLKASSDWHYCERQKGRFENGFGRDDFGFSALPAGYRMNYSDYDEKIGFTTCFHSIEMDGSSDTAVCLPCCNDSIILQNNFSFNAYSIRCIKDDEQKNGANGASSFVPPSNVVRGTFKDPRDKKTYKTVKIGSQTWMAENIQYKTKNSECQDGDDNGQNCAESDRLYTWAAALKACPRGWHLPTEGDWNTLVSAVGGRLIASKVLKTTELASETHGTTVGWCDYCNDVEGNGTDDYGFAARPVWDEEALYNMNGLCAGFWSSTSVKADSASVMNICCYEHTNITNENKTSMYTVRCVKD